MGDKIKKSSEWENNISKCLIEFESISKLQDFSVIASQINKTSIQWTPGSQIYLSSMEIFSGQNDF